MTDDKETVFEFVDLNAGTITTLETMEKRKLTTEESDEIKSKLS